MFCVCGCTSVWANEKNGGYKERGVRETRGEKSYGTEMVSSETITRAVLAVLTATTTLGALLLFAPRISSEIAGALELGNGRVILCGFSPIPLTFAPGLSGGFPGTAAIALGDFAFFSMPAIAWC